jgi:hypothetical protein
VYITAIFSPDCAQLSSFLSPQTLTKKYTVSPDLLDEKAPALTDTSCSEVEWKAGKNLTVTETVKKQKAKSGKNKGQVRLPFYCFCLAKQ